MTGKDGENRRSENVTSWIRTGIGYMNARVKCVEAHTLAATSNKM